MLRTYNQKHYFQFLFFNSRTQETINYNKDNSKKKENKIETKTKKNLARREMSTIDEFVNSVIPG